MSGAITGTTLAIMGGVGAAASIGGAAISANAAGNAAGDQESAANNAANLQYQASQNALDFQKQEYNQSQANIQPWIQSGQAGLSNLDYLLGVGGPQSGATATAPTPPTSNPSQQFGGTGSLPSNNSGVPSPSAYQSNFSGVHALTSPQSGVVSAGLSPNNATGTSGSPYSMSGTGDALTPSTAGSTPVPETGASPQSSVVSARPIMGGAPNNSSSSSAPSAAVPSAGSASPGAAASPSSSATGGYGSLMQGYGQTFQAPTAQQGMQSPGTQAQLQLGEQALQQSAAAQGNLLTGGTAQALDQYGQQVGAQGYQNAYNDSYNTFASNYNQYQQQQANEYNRLASLSGIGQTSAQQLGTLGQSASNNVSSNLLGTASAIGQDYQNAGAANASGVVGAANAYSGGLSSTGSSLQNLLLLSQLQGAGAANYGGGAQTGELS
jgi:hypothetical protein